MSADFSKLMQHLGDNLQAHADRDGLTGVMRAVFIARGGHAPGTVCPTAEPVEHHDSGCAWFMGEACDFGCAPAAVVGPAAGDGKADDRG